MSDADLRQRTCAARLSRRDAARGQGRADLHARSGCSISTLPKPRAPTCSSTPSPTTRWCRRRREAFCSRRYRLVEAAAGAVAEAVLEHYPQVRASASPCTSRMRRSPPPSTTSASSSSACGRARMAEALAEAFIALGGNVGDVRATFDRAMRLLCDERRRAAARPIVRLSDPAVGRHRPAAVHQCCDCVATTLSPRALLARAAADRTRARPRPRQTNNTGDRGRSISISSLMTISSLDDPDL